MIDSTLGPAGATRATLEKLRSPSPRTQRIVRSAANGVGAFGAALFAKAGLQYFLATRSFNGAAFFAEQLWVVGAYVIRRPAATISARTGDWLLATGGTFGGVLLRPTGVHAKLAVTVGLDLQLAGLILGIASFVALGRSFGFAAADRGLQRRGPYRVVRHPIYASYFLLISGYVLQSFSWHNVLVMVSVLGCDLGRAQAEERLLRSCAPYDDYAAEVRWRLLPHVW
jgi:protein-S-isoprenylcysteine O-methyltransferase Ste14